MKTNTVLLSATRSTLCNAAARSTTVTSGQVCLVDEDSGWNSSPADRNRHRVPINFEPRPQPQKMRRLRPMHRWGVVLAGGDGVRMREYTQLMWGSDRPKQFCPLLGNGTLLEQTRLRAERSITPEQILYSVTQAHERFYVPSLGRLKSRRVVQPSNKGTAPAILAPLVQIARMDPNAIVTILPCDHFYSPESAFTAALDSAFNIAEECSASVLIMGTEPRGPEVEYGWIELGPAASGYSGVHDVTGFREKPSAALAERLFSAGSLWNTFVMVGHVCAFLEMAWKTAPWLLRTLESPEITSRFNGEIRIPESVYERIAAADFSREILVPSASRLLAFRLKNVEWADIGNPDRLLRTILHSQNASLDEQESPAAPLKAFRAGAS